MVLKRKINMLIKVLCKLHQFMSSWVVRAALLLLGCWSSCPQPNAHHATR
jgi:hypothetical protein